VDDHFLDILVRDSLDQLGHRKRLGRHTFEGGNSSLQHVIQPVVAAGLLDGDHIAGLLDHADSGAVAARVGAQLARVGLCDVETGRTYPRILFQIADGPCQFHRLVGAGP